MYVRVCVRVHDMCACVCACVCGRASEGETLVCACGDLKLVHAVYQVYDFTC